MARSSKLYCDHCLIYYGHVDSSNLLRREHNASVLHQQNVANYYNAVVEDEREGGTDNVEQHFANVQAGLDAAERAAAAAAAARAERAAARPAVNRAAAVRAAAAAEASVVAAQAVAREAFADAVITAYNNCRREFSLAFSTVERLNIGGHPELFFEILFTGNALDGNMRRPVGNTLSLLSVNRDDFTEHVRNLRRRFPVLNNTFHTIERRLRERLADYDKGDQHRIADFFWRY